MHAVTQNIYCKRHTEISLNEEMRQDVLYITAFVMLDFMHDALF